MLRAESLSKSFGDLRAVAQVTLSLTPGAVTGLIGPNGAGKTTLFNLLAGTLRPDEGRIWHDGGRIDHLASHRRFRRGIARTFQIPRPFPDMSVLENLLLVPEGQSGERFWNNWRPGAAIARQESANAARARGILEFTALGGMAGAPARTLSGGQRKLLELARVLMAEPKIILLDEPCAGVNPVLIGVLEEKILTLNRRGMTFLIIEHNMEFVMRLCQPIFVMAQGRLIAGGDAASIRSDPRVVEAYLGTAP